MDRKIILFNAPPKSGKDFSAEFIRDKFEGVRVDKFARILKEKTHALYGFHWRAHDYYENVKNEPNDDFLGLSPRQAYIKVSETYFKPVHGDKIFGEMLANDLDNHDWSILAISDSGFAGEAEVLIDKYDAQNVTLVQITRDGCDFTNDSRSYISLPVETVHLHNDGTPDYEEFLYDLVATIMTRDEHIGMTIPTPEEIVQAQSEEDTERVDTRVGTINGGKGLDPLSNIGEGVLTSTTVQEALEEVATQAPDYFEPVQANTFPEEPIKVDEDPTDKDYVFMSIVENHKPSLIERLKRLIGI